MGFGSKGIDTGRVNLGGAQPTVNVAPVLPSGTVVAGDGSTISWSIDGNGTLTALGAGNQQLVVSRIEPRGIFGADALGAIDESMGGGPVIGGEPGSGSGPSTGGGPSAGAGDKSIGEGGYSDSAVAPVTARLVPTDHQSAVGLEMVYSTVGQGDPYLTIREGFSRANNVGILDMQGLAASVKFRFDASAADMTHVPTRAWAKFGQKAVEWDGTLNLTGNPMKVIARIPDWRHRSLEHEFAGAAYFDPLLPVVQQQLAAPAPTLPDGTIAKDTAERVLVRGLIAGVVAGAGGVAAGAKGGAGGMVVGGVAGFIFGFTGSMLVDIYNWSTEYVEAEAPTITPDEYKSGDEETSGTVEGTAQEDAPPPKQDDEDETEEDGTDDADTPGDDEPTTNDDSTGGGQPAEPPA